MKNLMNEDYTIEQLEKTFKEHAEVQRKEDDERRRIFAMENDEPYPYPPFIFAEAMHMICKEINQLKVKLGNFPID